MFVYIWVNVKNLTPNYHSNGDCTIVAESLEAARKLAATKTLGDWPDLLPESEIFSNDPTFILPLDASVVEKLIIISPNAGCC